jgi:hypothetical protein
MNEGTTAPALQAADIARIMKLLPHRYPFLLIDRMYDMNGEESGTLPSRTSPSTSRSFRGISRAAR